MKAWHYMNSAGERCEEHLTDDQCAVDTQLVREFEVLEGEVSKGRDLTNKVYEAQVVAVHTLVKHLPDNRAAHWAAELARIGIPVPAKAKAAATKNEDTSKSAKG